MMTDEYKYACGNTPKVGDLIEFGTRHKRYIVTSISEDGSQYELHCGDIFFQEMSLCLTRLIARHGQAACNEKVE